MEKEIDIQQLVSCLTGNCSQKEQELVEQWIVLSSENALLYDELKLVWNSATVNNESGYVDIDKAWEDFKTRTNFNETKSIEPIIPNYTSENKGATSTNGIKKILYYTYRIAALAVILLGFYLFFNRDNLPENQEFVTTIVQSDSPIVLPDGSNVVMDEKSSVEFPNEFAFDTRNVNFKGEAFFDIAHNPDKPMIITAGNVRIKVLGTSFNLCNRVGADDVSVYLESGKIIFYSVDSGDGSVLEQIILTPGQKGVYNKGSGLISKHEYSNNNHLAWKTGMLEFTNTPLTDVIMVLESTYHVSIEAEIPIGNYKLTARFNNEALKSILQSLQTIYGFNFEIDNSTILIY